MKLTVAHLLAAMQPLANIINENRPMPQKGKYRLARMYAKLKPEYDLANKQRDDLIKGYDMPVMASVTIEGEEPTLTPTDQFQVPADKMEEFTKAWAEIEASEIEVEVEPIPLDQLDLGPDKDGAVSAFELTALGDLVKE